MDQNTNPRAELVLIRHAPAALPGRLYGRTDVAARIAPEAIDPLRTRLGPIRRVVSSPARRCRQTADALFGVHDQDERLWEQDFGDHDGIPFEALPDIGVLERAALAAHRPPNGESFADLCARASPALADYGQCAHESGPLALVVHAGVIRAALALVLQDVPGALAFEIATLSTTRLRCDASGPRSIIEVNRS